MQTFVIHDVTAVSRTQQQSHLNSLCLSNISMVKWLIMPLIYSSTPLMSCDTKNQKPIKNSFEKMETDLNFKTVLTSLFMTCPKTTDQTIKQQCSNSILILFGWQLKNDVIVSTKMNKHAATVQKVYYNYLLITNTREASTTNDLQMVNDRNNQRTNDVLIAYCWSGNISTVHRHGHDETRSA